MTRERHVDPPLSSQNFGAACDDAVAKFLEGDISRFGEVQSRLETLKIGTVRSLLNQEKAKLMETEGDQFNQRFKLTNDGDEVSEEEEKDEMAP